MPAARRATQRRQAAPEPEPAASLNGEKDYTVYADKKITPTMEAFHEWLEDVVGIDLDPKSVSLGGSLRMDFQRSDFWAEDDRNRRNKVEEPDDDNEEEQPTRRTGKAKPTRRGRKPEPEPDLDIEDEDEDEDNEPETDEDNEPEEAPAPRRSGRRQPAAKAEPEPAKPARTSRRQRRAAAEDDNPAAAY